MMEREQGRNQRHRRSQNSSNKNGDDLRCREIHNAAQGMTTPLRLNEDKSAHTKGGKEATGQIQQVAPPTAEKGHAGGLTQEHRGRPQGRSEGREQGDFQCLRVDNKGKETVNDARPNNKKEPTKGETAKFDEDEEIFKGILSAMRLAE